MEIQASSIVEYPRTRVYEVYRDELPEIADYIPNVTEIEVLSRDEVKGGIDLHNLWHAESKIPRVAQALIKPEMLKWEDYAHWRDKKYECAWELQTHVFPDAITCSGKTIFKPDGRTRCEVIIEGDLEIDLAHVPGIPRLLRGSVGPQIEKFVVALIRPNLIKVSDALGEYLDAAG